jgi:hypothetical protein
MEKMWVEMGQTVLHYARRMRAVMAVVCGGVVLAASLAPSVAQAGNLGISVDVLGEVLPGVYGQVNVTNHRPQLVYSQPLVIERTRFYEPPVYLHVPPGHARKWEKHCYRYGACARPVYFVRSDEYSGAYYRRYEPRYVYREPYVQRDYYSPRPVADWAYRDGYKEGRRDQYKRERREDRRENRDEWRDDHHDDHRHGKGRGRGRGHDD